MLNCVSIAMAMMSCMGGLIQEEIAMIGRRWLRRLQLCNQSCGEQGWRLMAESGSTWSDCAACPGAVFGVVMFRWR